MRVRGSVHVAIVLVIVGWLHCLVRESEGGEARLGDALYNGIQLPAEWPPRASQYAVDAVTPPYLKSPPRVIPIDIGRQLLVDDFLVEESTLQRTFHRPEYYEGNPILIPEQPWELTSFNYRNLEGFPGPVAGFRGPSPYAMPHSDGVWFDPHDRLFKMWYYGGEGPAPSQSLAVTCYAESHDGIHWKKPKLSAHPWLDIPKTNIVQYGKRGSAMVWLDHEAKKQDERFKMWHGRVLFKSPDGIEWTKVRDFGKSGDRTTFFRNPFRQRWVFSIKTTPEWGLGRGRTRLYAETDDFFAPPVWGEQPGDKSGNVVIWTAPDSADPGWKGLDIAPELYNLDGVAYESLVLGLFTIWRGDTNEMREAGRPKLNEVFVGFSRDGFHWHRPDRRPFLPITEQEGAWNWGNVQSAGGCCLIVGDRLYFYCGGRAGAKAPGSTNHSAGSSTGVAFLRRDGFASLDADAEGGFFTTRPLKFTGRRLFVNVAAPEGELRVDVLDEGGRTIAPFTREQCEPIRADSTLCEIRWKEGADLSSLCGKPVRFRFHLKAGALYSFWVSPDNSGASHGYVAAGGPGYSGPTDTVGRVAVDIGKSGRPAE